LFVSSQEEGVSGKDGAASFSLRPRRPCAGTSFELRTSLVRRSFPTLPPPPFASSAVHFSPPCLAGPRSFRLGLRSWLPDPLYGRKLRTRSFPAVFFFFFPDNPVGCGPPRVIEPYISGFYPQIKQRTASFNPLHGPTEVSLPPTLANLMGAFLCRDRRSLGL